MKITPISFNIWTITILLLIQDIYCFSRSSLISFSVRNSQPKCSKSHVSRSPSFYNHKKHNIHLSYPKISSSRNIGPGPPSLPPGDGNKFEGLTSTLLTVAGITLFFASPLGGIFFAITNSIFILVLAVPILAIVGFQTWSAFNTVEGACPNCGSNVVVLKNSESENPSLCINCGVLVRSTKDKKGIELCNAAPSDDFFGVGGNEGGGIFDIFDRSSDASSSPSVQKGVLEDKTKKAKREKTIIDVDVSED